MNSETSAFNHRQTDLSSVHAHDRQDSVAKQETDQIVSELAEKEIVLRASGKRHAECNDETNAGEKIHRRLVGDQHVDVTAEMPTCKDQDHKDHSISAHSSNACNKADQYRRDW